MKFVFFILLDRMENFKIDTNVLINGLIVVYAQNKYFKTNQNPKNMNKA
jgi:hypothetical protein